MRHRPHEDKKLTIKNQSKVLRRQRRGLQLGRTPQQPSSRETAPTQNTLLLKLPAELLCEIAGYLRLNEHNALCQTCRYLCQTLTGRLYKCGDAKLAHAIGEKNGIHAVSAWIRFGATKGTVLCGATALTHAALCSVKIVDMVLATEGNIESIVESDGRTPLSHAAKYGKLENVKRLVEAGCPTNVTDNDGETPLFLAVNNGHLSTVKYLLGLGVRLRLDASLANKISSNVKMVRLLKRHGVR